MVLLGWAIGLPGPRERLDLQGPQGQLDRRDQLDLRVHHAL
jgi:hypothetical protein